MTQNPQAKIYTSQDLYAPGNAGHWLGYSIAKSPFDLMAFHNLLYDVKPDLLIETGTWRGGSALFYATIMDATNHGNVMTIDNWEWRLRPQHPRIMYVALSSVDEMAVKIAHSYACQCPRVMVTLDSAHDKEHVLKELDLYAPMVTQGSYLVVEDTNINGHPVREDFGPGPWEALHEWLPNHPEFVIDHNVEQLYTNNPDGWLQRVK